MADAIEFIIELVLCVGIILCVHLKADSRLIIEACTFYLAAVIRHSARTGGDEDDRQM